MELIKVKNYEQMSRAAADIVIRQIKQKPNSAIVFPTGKTPKKLYKLLVKSCKKGEISFKKIKAFNLDEYCGKKDRRSFYYYLHKRLFDKVNFKKENINLLNGEAKNFEGECRDYENRIRKSEIDLMILGVGENGHIAFNEPGSLKNSKTRLVEIKGKKALTIGISTIMSARKLLLVASGKKKAKAINCLINCKPDKCWPVTFLKNHKNLTVIADKNAGRLI